jgi:Rha family phage regulatory protein
MSTVINYAAVSNLVITHEDVPMTTSLKVAEVFGKKHLHVMEAIRNLDCPASFIESNFRLNEYPVKVGFGTRMDPMYLMTRDGFTFLAMGFNGARAAEFKIKYIDEFNRMEDHIRNTPKFAVPQTMLQAMELAIAQMKENEKLTAENAIMLPKAEVYDAVVADKMMSVTQFARSLKGCNTTQTKKDLKFLKYLYKTNQGYRVYSQYRDKYFVEKVNGFGNFDIYVTDEGKKLMTKLYRNLDLTLKVA